MEEPAGAQYAVQIAVRTLKERCKSLQLRVTTLEEENINLRVQCNKKQDPRGGHDENHLEVDTLRTQLTELAEQKQQLMAKVKMVMSENQDLWAKLGKLTQVNQNLGTQLNKINDSIVQYSNTSKIKEGQSPLIRSRTFTQDEPHTRVLQKNLEENGKICAELEEISLKILNSFAQSKSELDSLCSEITSEMTDTHFLEPVITDSCGFYYDENFDSNLLEEFNTVLEELRETKEVVCNQKIVLEACMKKLVQFQEKKTAPCDKDHDPPPKEMVDKGINTILQTDLNSPPAKSKLNPQHLPITKSTSPRSPKSNIIGSSSGKIERTEGVMICPVCCLNFSNGTDFPEFQTHVESHFMEETFEVL